MQCTFVLCLQLLHHLRLLLDVLDQVLSWQSLQLAGRERERGSPTAVDNTTHNYSDGGSWKCSVWLAPYLSCNTL